MVLQALCLLMAFAQSSYDVAWRASSHNKIDGGAAVVAGSNVWKSSKYATNARLPICSVSKLMTAQIVLELAAEGKLTLGQQVGEILPWLPEHVKPVTISNLLTHTSGLQNMDNSTGKNENGIPLIYLSTKSHLKPLRTRIKQLSGERLLHAPGTNFDYNNLDFLILQAVVEQACKQPFDFILRERIVKPAGMKNTSVAPWGALPANILKCYTNQNGAKVSGTPFNFGIYGGAGGILSTLDDVCLWLQWSMKQPERWSPFFSGSAFGGFQGYGCYAYQNSIFGQQMSIIERPGAIANYQWQITAIPSLKTAAVVFALNEGAEPGSVYQKSGAVVELMRLALKTESSEPGISGVGRKKQ